VRLVVLPVMLVESQGGDGKVGRCRLTVITSVLKAPMASTPETVYHELLSIFALNFNLRRYSKGLGGGGGRVGGGGWVRAAPPPPPAPPPPDLVHRAREAVAVGPGRYCSPRHSTPFHSRNEGPKFM